MPASIPAGRADALPPGARKLVFMGEGESILVMNVDGQYFAMENSCPHAGASIASGPCEGHRLSCPAHGLRFDIRSGECVGSPGMRLTTFAVDVVDGDLLLRPSR
ncbi:Rieske (2Fe-2S) protein [Diaphorobacter caeni]|uniref:Rieske (2Fe-2S) protein n=1 Tax=Diaphorobacter caeni TaxID=2784387 RepID=UPI0018907800|nr:Rieske (2Fe-2S) protein [Diaphorobacter caeni]MBF5005896.1 Rieske (2Fe-2S) protein [Diaphorobacter caeni]